MEDRMESGKQDNMNISTGAMGVSSDAAVALLLTNGNEYRRDLQKKYGKFFLYFSAAALLLAGGFLLASFFVEDFLLLRYLSIGIGTLWLICGIVILLFIFPEKAAVHFTEKILPGICELLDPELEYAPEDGVPIADYRASGLFPIRCKSYRYCDLVTGSYRGKSVSFSNFQTTCEREITDTRGKKRIMEHVLFSGVFLTCGPMDGVTQNILVIPLEEYEKMAAVLSDVSSPMLIFRKPVALQNAEDFQEHFAVFSADEEQAKTFLTPERCARICALRKELEGPLCISYMPDHTYAAVGKMIDLSAHSIWSPLGNDEIRKPYQQLEQILRIPGSL